jgi:SpoVK/Ycf46/Vps4 family AAA+-type ATPase
VTVSALESLIKVHDYSKQALVAQDLTRIKKDLVERDSAGLIEFIESTRTLTDYCGQDALKQSLRQDISLWQSGDIKALPMGYLLCGPVGTGKTFLVECLAGEAGVPVVRLKNFRDRWVGSSEGNLEKIFRLVRALGRCMVFIDEADQTLGRRESGSGDNGLSGRLYSMIAQEMADTGNRGRVLWILASSRPDLIEVDLKRPGRVDVKVPLMPTATPAESAALLSALAKRYGLPIETAELEELDGKLPTLLTPGAAEALVVKAYRHARTQNVSATVALAACLTDYQNPIPADVLEFQMRIAVREATDLSFVPPQFRKFAIVSPAA